MQTGFNTLNENTLSYKNGAKESSKAVMLELMTLSIYNQRFPDKQLLLTIHLLQIHS